MNSFQRIVWLARRNFTRGSLWNLALIFLVAVATLVFFSFYLFSFSPDPSLVRQLKPVAGVINGLFFLILAVVFISLLAIFNLLNRVRYHEIGLLRGIGAKRRYVFLMVLLEVQFIVFVGALFAAVIILLLSLLGVNWFSSFFLLGNGATSVFKIIGYALLAVFSTAFISGVAALYPAVIICGIEPYNAIRNRE